MYYYKMRAKRIKQRGITITPSKDYPVYPIAYYLQNDPAWASDTIGKTTSTLGATGCLIACVASSLTDLGIEVTPQELNQEMTEIDGFLSDNLIWYKINERYPNVTYRYSRVFSVRTIEKDLKTGLYPIVNAKYYGNGVTHWRRGW